MAADLPGATRFSLRRWSQRKLEAARGGDSRLPASDSPSPAGTGDGGNARDAGGDAALVGVADPSAVRASGARQATTGNAAALGSSSGAIDAAIAPLPGAADALPPVESLTSDSDFAPFLRPGVDEGLKRSALRKLFSDPRFNVMDGLDVYIDDYAKPSPIEPELVRKLMQARYIFDPPQTRVNAQGHVEDVADERAAPLANEAPAPGLADAAHDAAAAVPAPTDSDVPSEPKAS